MGRPIGNQLHETGFLYPNRKFYPNNLLVINTQDKLEVLPIVKMILFWVVTPYILVVRHVLETRTVSIFRAKDLWETVLPSFTL
jgi:hypothetical protein